MKKPTSLSKLRRWFGQQKGRTILRLALIVRRRLVSPVSPPSSSSGVLEPPTAENLLYDLPIDILFLILSELDAGSLLRCKQVCRMLRRLVEESERLTYTIELGINGMVDGLSTAGRSAAERRQALRQYSAQLYAAAPTRQDVEEYEGSGWSKLQKAVARYGCCPTAYVRDHGRTLVVDAPRSVQGGLEARRWIVPLGLGMELVAVDVAQDLLVLRKDVPGNSARNMRIHLRSLGASVVATDHPHPEATQAVLDVKNVLLPTVHLALHVRDRRDITDAQIYGPYLAWKVPNHVGEAKYALEVWNWKKGFLLWHGHFPQFLSDTYTFIDMEYLAVTLNGKKVAAYRFLTSEVDPACPYLDIAGLPSVTVVDTKVTTPLFALELFPHARDCRIVEPSPCAISPLPPPSALFWLDPALRTVVLQFHMFASSHLRHLLGESLNSSFVLLIPQSTFHEHIKRASAQTTSDEPRVLPWRDWGERGSVVLKSGTLPAYLPHIVGFYNNSTVVPLGSRIAVFTLNEANQVHLTAIDINPLAAVGSINDWSNGTRRTRHQGRLDVVNPPYPEPFIHTTYPRTYINTQ